MTSEQPRDAVNDQTRTLFAVALLNHGVGVYVLYYPSEGMITLFAIMMLVTLLVGAISGLIAAGAS
jgi:preprotein translocase subunit SecF